MRIPLHQRWAASIHPILFWLASSRCLGSAVPHWQSVVSDAGAATPLFREARSLPNRTAAPSATSAGRPRRRQRRGDGPEWYLSSADRVYTSVPATVPGDAISDLWKAGLLDDPYRDRNFLTQQQVWMGTTPFDGTTTTLPRMRARTWIYETRFALPPHPPQATVEDPWHCSYLLVFEGVKMGATVALNGVPLGVIRNQFVRTVFVLPPEALRRRSPWNNAAGGGRDADGNRTRGFDPPPHRLTVAFDPDIDTKGRFMACSGGWDWAPYTRAVDARGSRIFTLGVVQPLYLVPVRSVWVEYVTTQIRRSSGSGFRTKGRWPSDRQDFIVQVHVKLQWTAASHGGRTDPPYAALRFSSNFSPRITRVYLQEQSSVVTVNLTASQVRLWWPAGLGAQPLYVLQVALESSACCVPRGSCDGCPVIEKRIGFRELTLITSSNASETSAAGEGSGVHGMYVRVNDAVALWCRGANLIPMDQLEGRQNVHPSPSGNDHATSYLWAVESAARANMNMIRVWGGGAVPPPEFYDACDEKGILVYQDLMFVEENGHGAFPEETVRAEIEHLVRRLSHHPSVALWNGCNECSADLDVYASFVMQTVAEVDSTRIIWPSSPSSHGWATGVDTANGKPNGKPLRVRMDNSRELHILEAHGPYQHGFSNKYPGVNGFPASNSNETLVPPIFHPQNVGASHPNTFISEFGSSVSSSFESMAALLPPWKWSLHGGEPPDVCQHAWGNLNDCNGTNAMAERNYPCDSRIEAYFGSDVVRTLDRVGRRDFQRQLYLCMIAQTLWIKGTIETMRAGNSYGSLLWQLNENWPTGGWGCIEYHDGWNQFGRWKPLMYLLRSHLFQDVLVACGRGNVCYLRNDSPESQEVAVTVEAWNLGGSHSARKWTATYSLATGRSQRWFTLPSKFSERSHVMLISNNASGEGTMSPSAYLWNLPMELPLHLPVQFRIQVTFHNSSKTCLEVEASGLALYVVVSAAVPGHFSDNAFSLRPHERKRIDFEPPPGYNRPLSDSSETFLRTLRVEHLGAHSTWIVVPSLSSSHPEQTRQFQ